MEDINLFVPCLVRQFLPEVGMATVQLLRHFGYQVHFDPAQVCCGQVFINWGQLKRAKKMARAFLRTFEGPALVVGPSGSCVAAVREKYGLLDLEKAEFEQWQDLRHRLFDVLEFMQQKGLKVRGRLDARVAIHRSCHLLREIGLDVVESDLWAGIEGIRVVYPEHMAECCGFGGVFSVKMGEVAAGIGRRVVQRLVDLEPDVIVVPDAGCIMQVRSVLDAMHKDIRVLHPVQLMLQAING